MKINCLIMCLLLVGLFSCTKGDSFDISKLTTFATFSEYEPFVVTELGEPFTPSIVAKEGDNILTTSVSGSVNVQVVGVYDLFYSATNSEGYDGVASQRVVVYDPSLTGLDVTGTIFQVGNPARTGTVTKVPGTTNIYLGSDVAFAGVFPLYFQMIGDQLNVIPQPFVFGVTSVTASYDPVGRSISLTVYPQGFSYVMAYN